MKIAGIISVTDHILHEFKFGWDEEFQMGRKSTTQICRDERALWDLDDIIYSWWDSHLNGNKSLVGLNNIIENNTQQMPLKMTGHFRNNLYTQTKTVLVNNLSGLGPVFCVSWIYLNFMTWLWLNSDFCQDFLCVIFCLLLGNNHHPEQIWISKWNQSYKKKEKPKTRFLSLMSYLIVISP